VVEALLAAPALQGVERVYLMTTNSAGFYRQLGFSDAAPQVLLVRAGQPSANPSRSPAGHSSSRDCS
jgi:N-acetylglutamate synthase-like GNAT family acetyltransferase